MDDALRLHASTNGEKVAVTLADGGARYSYAELDRQADAVTASLQATGLTEGETIVLLVENGSDVLALWWGARRAGLYYVPLSPRLTPSEIAYIAGDCAARAIVASPALMDIARECRLLIGDPTIRLITTGRRDADSGSVLDDVGATLQPVGRIGRELIYSSGTTGRPKGIRRPLDVVTDAHGLPALEKRMREVFRIAHDTIYLSVAPMYHATGRFLNRVIEAGGTVVILPSFDAEAALAAIERHRVTNTQWVPTMFVRLLAMPAQVRRRYDLSSQRIALHAAAPCPIPVKLGMIDWWGPIVDEYYGGTENAGVTFITACEWLERPGSVGKSIAGAVHILDEAGDERELPAGNIGLIYFEDGVPFTYMNGAQGERMAATRLGYTTYGDLGHIDAEGYLYISDRRTDLIITGGVNVYPGEVERVLEAHPAVAEVAVIGTPDEEFGSRVRAIVVPADGRDAGPELADTLLDHCRLYLSRIKCPRDIEFVDALPRNENGKLLKRVLRDRYREPTHVPRPDRLVPLDDN